MHTCVISPKVTFVYISENKLPRCMSKILMSSNILMILLQYKNKQSNHLVQSQWPNSTKIKQMIRILDWHLAGYSRTFHCTANPETRYLRQSNAFPSARVNKISAHVLLRYKTIFVDLSFTDYQQPFVAAEGPRIAGQMSVLNSNQLFKDY